MKLIVVVSEDFPIENLAFFLKRIREDDFDKRLDDIAIAFAENTNVWHAQNVGKEAKYVYDNFIDMGLKSDWICKTLMLRI